MRTHVIGFTISGATPDSPDWTPMLAVDDSVFAKSSNTGLFVPAGMRLLAAYAIAPIGTTWSMPRFRINAASLLRVGYPEITPVNAVTTTNDPNVQVLLDRPIHFPRDESLGVDVMAESPSSSGNAQVVLVFGDTIEAIPDGEAFWIAGTSATPASAGVWTALSTTWPTLPEGEYLIIGMAHACANPVAARLRLFSGQTFRPGTVATASTTDRTSALFTDGQLGVLGRFASYAPPVVEVLSSDAPTLHKTFLRVLRVG